jgi:hypothetical protein
MRGVIFSLKQAFCRVLYVGGKKIFPIRFRRITEQILRHNRPEIAQ